MNTQNSLSTSWSIPVQVSPTSHSHQIIPEVAQRVEEVSLTPSFSHIFIRTLIADWNTPQVQRYLSEILAKDSLLWDIFEVTSGGLQVRKNSPVLEAHFGDLYLENNQKSSLRVVPGVILKRLIASIFGIDLYSSDEHAPASIVFNSGVTPTAVLNFELGVPQDGQLGEIPELSLFIRIGEQKKLALSITGGKNLSSEKIWELTKAAIKPRTEAVNLSPTKPLEHLAQQWDFRFALNIGVLDHENQIYQTVFAYPRQIGAQAILEHRNPSIVFARNAAWDFEVPWEILEEAVCQAATLAAQKYIFTPKDTTLGTSIPKKWSLPKDTLIVLSQSTSQIYRLTPMSEREFFIITLKVTMTGSGKAIDIIEYIVTSKTSAPEAKLIMSGSIVGTRVPKALLARALKS